MADIEKARAERKEAVNRFVRNCKTFLKPGATKKTTFQGTLAVVLGDQSGLHQAIVEARMQGRFPLQIKLELLRDHFNRGVNESKGQSSDSHDADRFQALFEHLKRFLNEGGFDQLKDMLLNM